MPKAPRDTSTEGAALREPADQVSLQDVDDVGGSSPSPTGRTAPSLPRQVVRHRVRRKGASDARAFRKAGFAWSAGDFDSGNSP